MSLELDLFYETFGITVRLARATTELRVNMSSLCISFCFLLLWSYRYGEKDWETSSVCILHLSELSKREEREIPNQYRSKVF